MSLLFPQGLQEGQRIFEKSPPLPMPQQYSGRPNPRVSQGPSARSESFWGGGKPCP